MSPKCFNNGTMFLVDGKVLPMHRDMLDFFLSALIQAINGGLKIGSIYPLIVSHPEISLIEGHGEHIEIQKCGGYPREEN